jgi:hypothetical protein
MKGFVYFVPWNKTNKRNIFRRSVWLSTAPQEPLTHWYQVFELLQLRYFHEYSQLRPWRRLHGRAWCRFRRTLQSFKYLDHGTFVVYAEKTARSLTSFATEKVISLFFRAVSERSDRSWKFLPSREAEQFSAENEW